MRIAKVVSKNNQYIAENVIRLIPPFGKQTEKNWAPLVLGNELYLVYSIEPEFIILKPDLKTGFTKVVVSKNNDTNFQFGELRGASAFIEADQGEFIGLVHTHFPDSSKLNHWYYFSFFTKITCKNGIDSCSVKTLEAPFLFDYAPYARCYNNLYTSGILQNGKDLMIFAGVNDAESLYIKLNINSLHQLLRSAL